MSAEVAASWRVVVPIKAQTAAKSRLHPPVGVSRSALAHAIALDTLAAVASAVGPAGLVVVTSDELTARYADEIGAARVPDAGGGLNAAVRAALESVGGLWGDSRAAVLLGDLPALRAQDLAAALTAAALHRRAFVPDADGIGTVLLTARRVAELVPRFGGQSARAHAADSVPLDLDLPRLRTDVDDDRSLRVAVGLGVGPRTSAVLAAAPLA